VSRGPVRHAPGADVLTHTVTEVVSRLTTCQDEVEPYPSEPHALAERPENDSMRQPLSVGPRNGDDPT